MSGWGAHTQSGRTAYGTWTEEERQHHVNVLEIWAVARLIYSDILDPGQSIQVYTDNITTMFAINKNGSTGSRWASFNHLKPM